MALEDWIGTRLTAPWKQAVQGEHEVLEALIEWAIRGPQGAKVESVTRTDPTVILTKKFRFRIIR